MFHHLIDVTPIFTLISVVIQLLTFLFSSWLSQYFHQLFVFVVFGAEQVA